MQRRSGLPDRRSDARGTAREKLLTYFNPDMEQLVILWSDGDWRGELHTEASGVAWLKIFKGDHLIVIESAFVEEPAFTRAEILRNTLCGPAEPRRMD